MVDLENATVLFLGKLALHDTSRSLLMDVPQNTYMYGREKSS